MKTSTFDALYFSAMAVMAFIAVIMCMAIDPTEKAMVVHPSMNYTVVATANSDNGQYLEVLSDEIMVWPTSRTFKARARVHLVGGALSVGERFSLPEGSENPLGPEIHSVEQLRLIR
jgi:hypothetical protein